MIPEKSTMGNVRWAIIFCAPLLFLILSGTAHSKYAEMVGAYLADENGNCKNDDTHFMTGKNICWPYSFWSGEQTLTKRHGWLSFLIGKELGEPDYFPNFERIALPWFEVTSSTISEAYAVEIKKADGNYAELNNGTMIKTSGTTFGYSQSAILYSAASYWLLCLNGKSEFVEVLQDRNAGSRHLSNVTVDNIEKSPECR
jgi:hypothetical protein